MYAVRGPMAEESETAVSPRAARGMGSRGMPPYLDTTGSPLTGHSLDQRRGRASWHNWRQAPQRTQGERQSQIATAPWRGDLGR